MAKIENGLFFFFFLPGLSSGHDFVLGDVNPRPGEDTEDGSAEPGMALQLPRLETVSSSSAPGILFPATTLWLLGRVGRDWQSTANILFCS